MTAVADQPRIIVPAIDPKPWPTLGPELCDWLEEYMVYGPGDVLGERIELTDEERILIYRMYEVYPRDHPRAGRRRFKRVGYFRRKGARKTELAAWLAIAEMDPTAPVRCDGWKRRGSAWIPVGRPVRDPFIPMMAYTEEQVEDLAYGAVRAIIENGPLVNDYDVGIERIKHVREPGEIKPVAGSPSARDGARTSWQHFDESHRLVSVKHKLAHATMLKNIPKRRASDPWTFETSTMYAPGEESVAEATHDYALEVLAGRVTDPQLLFDHRQASLHWDIDDPDQLVEAIVEASGDAIAWADVDAIAGQFHVPNADKGELRRFWLNQRWRSAKQWIDPMLVDRCMKIAPDRRAADGERIVLVFDGSYSRDSTALVGVTVERRPHGFVIGHWQRPLNARAGWRTPRGEVMDAVAAAMERWEVVELSCDPFGWGIEVEEWEQTYDVTEPFPTNQPSRFGPAVDAMEQAICGTGDDNTAIEDEWWRETFEIGEPRITFEDHPALRQHFANCVPVRSRGYTVVTKESTDSPHKIDLAVGMIMGAQRAWWHHLNGVEEDIPFAFA